MTPRTKDVFIYLAATVVVLLSAREAEATRRPIVIVDAAETGCGPETGEPSLSARLKSVEFTYSEGLNNPCYGATATAALAKKNLIIDLNIESRQVMCVQCIGNIRVRGHVSRMKPGTYDVQLRADGQPVWFRRMRFPARERQRRNVDTHETSGDLLEAMCRAAADGSMRRLSHSYKKLQEKGWAPLIRTIYGKKGPPRYLHWNAWPLYSGLACAAGAGQLDVVIELSKKNVPLDPPWEAADARLKSGEHVSDTTSHGSTPLHQAAQGGHLSVVKWLIEHGATLSPQVEVSPLRAAVEAKQYAVIAYLNEQGAMPGPDERELWLAVARSKRDVTTGMTPNVRDQNAVSAAMFVMLDAGDATSAVKLASQGIDPNFIAIDPRYSVHLKLGLIHVAVRANSVPAVKVLLDAGANPNLRGDCASRSNVSPNCEALGRMQEIEGHRWNATREENMTPLHWASFVGNPQIVRLLLQHDSDPDARTGHGFTPAHIAAWRNNQPVISLLERYGADLSLTSKNGNSAADFAALPPIVESLKSASFSASPQLNEVRLCVPIGESLEFEIKVGNSGTVRGFSSGGRSGGLDRLDTECLIAASADWESRPSIRGKRHTVTLEGIPSLCDEPGFCAAAADPEDRHIGPAAVEHMDSEHAYSGTIAPSSATGCGCNPWNASPHPLWLTAAALLLRLRSSRRRSAIAPRSSGLRRIVNEARLWLPHKVF